MSYSVGENASQKPGRAATVHKPRREPRNDKTRRDTRDASMPVGGIPADTAFGEAVASDLKSLTSIDHDPAELPAVQDAEEGQVALSEEMRDAFRRFRASPIGSRSAKVARAMSQLMRIRLPYPRQIEAMAEFEELRLLGLDMRGEQQLGVTIFERTGCGKSTAAAQYKAMLLSECAPGTLPVVHARLGTSGSARDLYVSIMSELGDGFAMSGTEHTLRRRAMVAMDAAGVELLVIDETHHGGRKTGFGGEITAELKIMLDTGKVPIVLLGTEEAVPIVGADRELSGRLFSPCRMGPLDVNDDEDWDLWCGFLQALDSRMVSDGIVTAPAGLDKEDVAIALGEVCDGIVGQMMRVMLMALREVTRDHRSVITITDLRTAVDQWSIELGFAKSNPFEGA